MHQILLMRSGHWFRYSLGTVRQQPISWTNVDQVLWHNIASLCRNESTNPILEITIIWPCQKIILVFVHLHEMWYSLHRRHNGHDGVSNHQRLDCLLNCLFRHRSKKTSKLRVTGPLYGELTAYRWNGPLAHYDVTVMWLFSLGSKE